MKHYNGIDVRGDGKIAGSLTAIDYKVGSVTVIESDGKIDYSNLKNVPVGSAATLDGLSDAAMTSKIAGDLLKWNGTKWTNASLLSADIPALDASKITTGVIADARLTDGTTIVKGIVKLSNAINSTSDVLAATPSAVKASYDLANAALPKTGGIVTGRLETQSGVDIKSSSSSKKFTIQFNPVEQSLDFIYT